MSAETRKVLDLWHGGRRWQGNAEVRDCVKGRYECGPGLYMTTSLMTASRYAKGGGQVMRFGLSPDIRWLEAVTLPLADLVDFVKDQRGMRRKAEIIADLNWSFERYAAKHGGDRLPAGYMLNLCVNHEALSGSHGPALAAFLADNGIDASLQHQSGREDWVIVFAPARVILERVIVPAARMDWSSSNFPNIEEQLTKMRAATSSLQSLDDAEEEETEEASGPKMR